jgi:hypothetical protein
MIRRTKLLCEGLKLRVQLGYFGPRDIEWNILVTEDGQSITAILTIIDDDDWTFFSRFPEVR